MADTRDRPPLLVALAVLVAVPGVGLRLTGQSTTPPLDALLFGLAIIGAAFLLSWAAGAAQVDISAGLAIALLALVAVLRRRRGAGGRRRRSSCSRRCTP